MALDKEQWKEVLRGVLVVGELNPYAGPARDHDDHFALYPEPRHAAGYRLMMVMGLQRSIYMGLRRANLCAGKWSMKAARDRAITLAISSPRVIVMLGRKVSTAFGCDDMAFFTSRRMLVGDGSVVCLPHPSGLCREWNEPGTYKRAREVLSLVEPRIPWGEG